VSFLVLKQLKANGVALLKCKALGSIFGGYFISMNMKWYISEYDPILEGNT